MRRGSRFVVILSALFVVVMVASSAVSYSLAAKGPKTRWSQTVLDDTEHFYVCDIGVGGDYLYALGWIYPSGQSLLFRSADEGGSWLAPITLTTGDYPGMCVYDGGESDVLLITGGYGQVLRSADSGVSWDTLASLPYGYRWATLAIGTNASWSGAPVDNDIYVVGAADAGWGYQTTMIVSHDDGLTWDAPVVVAPTVYQNGWCEVLVVGSSIYVAYTLFGNDPDYGAMCMRASSDWGATWTAEKIVATSYNAGYGVLLKPMSLRYVDGEKVFITMADCTDVGAEDQRAGRWGFISLSDLSYNQTGSVSWKCGDFAGMILPDGKLAVVYETYLDGNVFPLMFAITKRSILT